MSARKVLVEVYDDEPGPEVIEVESLGSGDRWRRHGDLWDLMVLSGLPERHPWANLVQFDDAPMVPVGTGAALRGIR